MHLPLWLEQVAITHLRRYRSLFSSGAGGMQKPEKKIKARDELIRFAEKETGASFHNLKATQQSQLLTKFYIKEVHNRTKTEISDEDLALAVVDGKNDLGCDLIHRDDGNVLIVQSKYRTANAREQPEDISHFQSVLTRLRAADLKGNSLVLDQISAIDWKNDEFTLVFLTTGSLKNQAGAVSRLPPHYPADVAELDARCEWHYLDEEGLNTEYRAALAYERGPSEKEISLYPFGAKGRRGASSIVSLTAGQYRSFIMALDANQIVNAYQQLDREQLFSLNIRNFIGNTATNRKIIETATQTPESFFLFNNGISCLCTRLTDHDDRIGVTGLQVINGAQTVKALVNAVRMAKGKPANWGDSPPLVLVRITEIPEGYGQSGAMRERVTQFNNTQNIIKVSDFRSNDPVQKHLKEQFASIRYQGKPVEYQAKRTDRVIRGAEVVRLEEFAKSIYAFLVDPTSFSGATAFLFDDQNGGYNAIFGDGSSAWEKMPEEEFRLRASIYWLAQKFANRLKEDRASETDPDVKAALERKWMLMFAARKVLELYFPNEAWKEQLARAYKGDWELGEAARGMALLRIYSYAKAGVVMAYKNAKANDRAFVHRNWMRGKDTPGQIATVLKDVIMIMKEPIAGI